MGGLDYDRYGHRYSLYRKADPRIARAIRAAIGNARSVVNVGAGSGSYEPRDRYTIAIEPSRVMRAQRRPGLPPAVIADASDLPFDEKSVDLCLALLTVHHWDDPEAGLKELQRVARHRVIVLCVEPSVLARFWLVEQYVPEYPTDAMIRAQAPSAVLETLGPGRVDAIPIPADCRDGFLIAYYGRPEAYLTEDVRAGQSLWPSLPGGRVASIVASLKADLESGTWDARNGHLRRLPSYDAGLRLVTIDLATVRQ